MFLFAVKYGKNLVAIQHTVYGKVTNFIFVSQESAPSEFRIVRWKQFSIVKVEEKTHSFENFQNNKKIFLLIFFPSSSKKKSSIAKMLKSNEECKTFLNSRSLHVAESVKVCFLWNICREIFSTFLRWLKEL